MKRGLCLLILCLSGCNATATPASREAATLGGVRQLTRDFADATDAVFSPDGRWIAFRAVPRGESMPQLYLARVIYGEGGPAGLGQPVRVTPAGSRSGSPAFDPDGRGFVFASTAAADPSADSLDFDRMVDLFRVDDWPRTLAAADPRAGVNLARRRLADRPGYDAEAVVAPGGTLIVFASDRDAEGGGHDGSDLYAMRLGGSTVTRLTTEVGRDGSPAISPDGRRVVFESDRAAAGRFDLYELTLETSNVRRLTTGADATRPTYTADGRGVVYATDADDRRGVGNRELHHLDLASGRDVRLTFDPAADDAPRVGADGRFLLFSSRRTRDGSRQVFVARFEVP